MQDKRITGEQNKIAILKWLHKFGWLNSKQLAELIWKNKSTGLAMAQRTVASMVESKLILKRKLSTGAEAILLASKGAAMLNAEFNIKAVSGAKLQLGNPEHRCASNWHLIQELENCNAIITEYEIQTGKVPMAHCHNKMPDGLVLTDYGVVWLEVENAWKNLKEREKIVQFCADTLSHINSMEHLWGDNFLFRVEIVAITSFSAEAIVRSFAKDFKDGLITETALQSIWLTYAPMSSGLTYPNANQVQKLDMWYDLVSYYIDGKPVKF
jgi:hypothetical protein